MLSNSPLKLIKNSGEIWGDTETLLINGGIIMLIRKNVLAPAVAEIINQVSGTYSAPFWDGLLAVTESLDTVRAAKGTLKALHNNKQDTEAYHLILALYDLAAMEVPTSIIELEPYPEGVEQFISEFLMDAEDLMIDYETEAQAANN